MVQCYFTPRDLSGCGRGRGEEKIGEDRTGRGDSAAKEKIRGGEGKAVQCEAEQDNTGQGEGQDRKWVKHGMTRQRKRKISREYCRTE